MIGSVMQAQHLFCSAVVAIFLLQSLVMALWIASIMHLLWLARKDLFQIPLVLLLLLPTFIPPRVMNQGLAENVQHCLVGVGQ